jgi:hypothetical protein
MFASSGCGFECEDYIHQRANCPLISLGGAREAAEVRAEAEALNADPQRGTAAVQEMLEEGFEAERALEILIDLDDLPMGESFPARTDGGVFAEAVKEELDLVESEIHVASEADEQHAVEGVGGVAALATDALGGSEEAHFFVVADGGGVEAGAGGKFPDLHLFFSKKTA